MARDHNEPARDDPAQARAQQKGGWRDTVKVVAVALLVALGIRTFAFEPFNIPSASMVPTLLVGDFLFVSKFSYGYSRHSFPLGAAPFEGRVFGDGVERGDVAVFKLPTDTSTDYVKRIIGLPGDEIQMRDGQLYINGEAVPRERAGTYEMQDRPGQPTLTQYVETLPNGRSYRILERSDNAPLDDTPVFEVPPGHYFAMGDNRDGSLDSRALDRVGYVPAENLVGRAELLFFSLGGGTRFWEIWRWPFELRFQRFFTDPNADVAPENIATTADLPALAQR